MKHAVGGARVHLAVAVTDTRLSIRVQDTGPAVRPGAPNQEGQGLVGMRERAALYRGLCTEAPSARDRPTAEEGVSRPSSASQSRAGER
ncbi:hypothetical protein ACIQ7S_14890 [Streptomyces griseoluteus]|uniref:hypothetical protein n=1 Tax=Streptomyces griseoluteus TaxID=29306 RepID=UPI00332C3AB1